jgi:hypothetical protein
MNHFVEQLFDAKPGDPVPGPLEKHFRDALRQLPFTGVRELHRVQ